MRCESASGRQHHDRRRLHWIRFWKVELAQVVATSIWFILEAKDHEVPDENVLWIGSRHKIITSDAPIGTVFYKLLILLRKCPELFLEAHYPDILHLELKSN